MYITKAVLKDFGKFHNTEIDLQPGLNLVYGANEAGKSTVQDFIIGMLYGIDKSRGLAARSDQYALRKPYDKPGFSGMLEVYSGGRAYRIERNFLRSEKETKLIDMETAKEVALSKPHSIEGILLEIDKKTYRNTLCIDSAGAGTDQALTEQLKKRMVNLSTTRMAEIDPNRAIALLKDKKNLYNTRELDREIQQTAEELNKEEGYDEALEEIAIEYEELNTQLMLNKQKQADITELYHVEKTKRSEKKSTIFLITLLLLALLCLAIYFLPVSNQAKIIIWTGSVLGVLYMLASTFAQKGRYLRTQKRKQARRQQEYEADDAIEREEMQRYTEKLAYLRAKEEQLLKAKKEKEAGWARYDELKAKAEQMRFEAKACDLAISTIDQLSNAIYHGYGNTLNRKASKIMEQITEGRYKQVFVGDNLDIQVLDGDRYVSLSYLSTATKEQLYFCLRMAAAELLGCPAMPLLLDDIFTTYDEDRLRHTLEFLAEYKENQMIMFTGNKGIADMFDEIGRDYNYIAL